MGKERLCDFCGRFGYCQFKAVADQIGDDVPEGAGRDEILAAHKKIADAREIARERGCPHINEVTLVHPGIKHL